MFQIKKKYVYVIIYSDNNIYNHDFSRLDSRENREERTKTSKGILAQTTDTPDCKEIATNTKQKQLFQEFEHPEAETMTKASETRIQILKCLSKYLATPQKGMKGEATCNLVTMLMTKRSDDF